MKIVDETPTLKADREDADTLELEDEIDGVDYDIYGLTRSREEVVRQGGDSVVA